MTNPDEQGLRWLAGSLAWERHLSTLRAADLTGTADVTMSDEVVRPGPEPVRTAPTAARQEDHRPPADGDGRAPVRPRPASEGRGADGRPHRVRVDGGVPSST